MSDSENGKMDEEASGDNFNILAMGAIDNNNIEEEKNVMSPKGKNLTQKREINKNNFFFFSLADHPFILDPPGKIVANIYYNSFFFFFFYLSEFSIKLDIMSY